MGDTVLAHVKANPGQRVEEIGRELGVATKDLTRPEGQKRGTKYFAGGRGGGGRKKAGQRGARKPAKRGKATKARGRRRGAKAMARKASTPAVRKPAQAVPVAPVAAPEAVQAA